MWLLFASASSSYQSEEKEISGKAKTLCYTKLCHVTATHCKRDWCPSRGQMNTRPSKIPKSQTIFIEKEWDLFLRIPFLQDMYSL